MLNGGKIFIDPTDIRDYPTEVKHIDRKTISADKKDSERAEEEEKVKEDEAKPEEKAQPDSKSENKQDSEEEPVERPKNLKNDPQNKTKLDGLVNKTDHVLLKVSNIIPILTTDVVVDSSKVSVIYRPFPFSERIHSISVRDITDVYIETVPFFATLNIVDTGFVENLVKITWLAKSDAEKARRIITGLMQANKENIDLKLVQDDNLGLKLEEIGKIRDSKTTVSNSASLS